MAVFAAIAFATFFLENDHFVSLDEGKNNLSVHFCAFNGRHTDFNVAVGIDKKNFVERDRVAFLELFAEMVDIQIFSFFNFKLLSFYFYNCVHLFVMQ